MRKYWVFRGALIYHGHSKIRSHHELLKEYEANKCNPDDLIRSYQRPDKSPVNTTYKQKLEIGFGSFNVFFSYDENKNIWDLQWNFASLLEALKIMYMMNFVGKMGRRIRICQYSKCHKEVIGNKYCCKKHDDAGRQAQHRAKTKKESNTEIQ